MSPARLNLIVVAVAAVLTAAFTLGLLIPGTRRLARCHAELIAQQQEIRDDQQKLGNVGDIYTSILKMKDQINELRRRVPTHRQVGEFLKDLSDALRLSEITEYDLKPSPAMNVIESRLPEDLKLVKDTTLIPIKLTFDATFPKLFEFLKRVEVLPRLSQIENLTVENDAATPGRIHVNMTIHTYRRHDF